MCLIPIDQLAPLSNCPADTELILFFNVAGQPTLTAVRTWAQIKSCLGGGGSLRLIVGEVNAPEAGQSTFQRNELIGLDPINTPARLSMKIDGQWLDSWGGNKSFDYNSSIGEIDLGSNEWNDGSSVEIPLTKTIS